MSADRVMAYLRSVPKPLKKNKKIIENLLTKPTRCGIIQVFQGNERIKGCDQRKKEVDYYGKQEDDYDRPV